MLLKAVVSLLLDLPEALYRLHRRDDRIKEGISGDRRIELVGDDLPGHR